MTQVNQPKDKLAFVHSIRFWKLFCTVVLLPGIVMFVFSFFNKGYESTIGITGILLMLLAWVGYCVLEGLKREARFNKEVVDPCPYNIETPEE